MCRMRENYEYDMFENYSEVVMLLVKVRQQNLTEEEEEKVRSWREERPENEGDVGRVYEDEDGTTGVYG